MFSSNVNAFFFAKFNRRGSVDGGIVSRSFTNMAGGKKTWHQGQQYFLQEQGYVIKLRHFFCFEMKKKKSLLNSKLIYFPFGRWKGCSLISEQSLDVRSFNRFLIILGFFFDEKADPQSFILSISLKKEMLTFSRLGWTSKYQRESNSSRWSHSPSLLENFLICKSTK